MPPPSQEKKKSEIVACAHAAAYRGQGRQMSRKWCEENGETYGFVTAQWLCPRCKGVFWGAERPTAGRKPDEVDHD